MVELNILAGEHRDPAQAVQLSPIACTLKVFHLKKKKKL